MEWGFDIGGGMSVRGLIGAEGSTGSEEGRRAPKRVDGLLDLFNPRHRPTREGRNWTRGEFHRSGLESVDRGTSSEHASSVVDVTAGTTRAGGRGAGRVGRSSARGVIAGRGARGEPRLRGVRSAPGLGRRPRMSARRLRVPWWCSATTRRRAGGEIFKRRAFALVPLARGWGARAIRGSRFGRASTIGARRARGPTRRCPRGGAGSAARAEV